jgi:AraC family transcriptional regulator of adaptative response / DNA-3-methyladenine glycosylase II
MLEPVGLPPSLPARICQRALDARDSRFDGLFFVGIVTTGIYCRPICPSKRADPHHRRFFNSAAAAERAGFRPCLRCRPELAPGRAVTHAVSRLACTAAHRIAAGALNGRSVAELAAELAVSERHLRRALRRELGVSPVELAQTHRLLLAKRLLAETALSVTNVAFASGFESLRRFNVAFHERYGMSPSALRRPSPAPASDLLRMTLAYRPPLAWDVLTAFLRRDAMPGVEIVEGRRYGRTVRLDGRSGVVFAEDAPAEAHVKVDISPSLLPVLMPLLARLRQLFDLDAQPTVVDAHLERAGLAALVRRHRGVRLPGALEETGVDERLATIIVMRALYWPDAFPASDRALQEAAGVASPRALRARAEKWRPWRAYAALHLWLQSAPPRERD